MTGFRGPLVLASSMVVYGEGRYECAEHGLGGPAARAPRELAAGRFEPPCPRCGRAARARAVPEDAPLDPRNVYAATKLAQEHLCAAFRARRRAGHRAALPQRLRAADASRHALCGGRGIFRSALAAGSAPRVFEDGGQRRDFVHVRDVAAADILALLAPEPVPGAFNVASGTPRTVLDMARALARALGDGIEPEVTGEWRLGDVRHVFASAALAERRLGFRAAEDFERGCASSRLRRCAPDGAAPDRSAMRSAGGAPRAVMREPGYDRREHREPPYPRHPRHRRRAFTRRRSVRRRRELEQQRLVQHVEAEPVAQIDQLTGRPPPSRSTPASSRRSPR